MKVAIIGNGAWGSALAELSRRRGHEVAVWGRHPKKGEIADLSQAAHGAQILILAIASHGMAEVCGNLKPHLGPGAILVSAAKGIDQQTHLRMSEIIAQATGRAEVATMSGPTFSKEVVRGAPSALVAAAADEKISITLQKAFTGEDFRVYTSNDLIGVELGGALKNVMAIAAGVCAGLGLGDNALAALITRGVAELARIGTTLGGQSQTFFGLSGMGDLILTCSSSQSRNRRVGEALGRGEELPAILAALQGTAEGVKTAKSVKEILDSRQLQAPILSEVHKMLYEAKPARHALRDLMGREPKAEF